MASEVVRMWLTTAEAAEYLGYPVDTLRTWRARNRGPKYSRPHAGNVRYRASDLEAFMDAHTVTPKS